MEVLATRFHNDVKPDVTIETPEQDFVLDVYAGFPQAKPLSTIIYDRHPLAHVSELYADDVLFSREQAQRQDVVNDGSFVRNVGPYGVLNKFEDLTKLPNILRVLGYSRRAEEIVLADVRHRWVEFTYPTVEQLNAFMDEVSPGEGVRYESFAGGRYSAVELAEALVAGKILIAEELDYQLHDHAALHVLGALGLHGEYLEHRQKFIEPYIKRYQAELKLPEVPGQDDEAAQRFLYPSHAIIRAFDVPTDNLTADIGDAVFSRNPYRVNDEQLRTTIEAASFLRDREGRMPHRLQLRGGPRPDVAGQAILDRFAKMEEAAKEMLGQQAA